MTHPPFDFDEDAVRRALADARHDAPMPADVAQRLDQVIAALATGATGTTSVTSPITPAPTLRPPLATVTDLARRRRRRRGALLAAAAAVVALASAPAWWPDQQGPASPSTADVRSTTTAPGATPDDEAAPPASRAESDGQSLGSPPSDSPSQAHGEHRVPRLSGGDDLQANLEALLPPANALAQPWQGTLSPSCSPSLARDRSVTYFAPLVLDGTPGLLLRRDTDQGLVAQVIDCSGTTLARFDLS